MSAFRPKTWTGLGLALMAAGAGGLAANVVLNVEPAAAHGERGERGRGGDDARSGEHCEDHGERGKRGRGADDGRSGERGEHCDDHGERGERGGEHGERGGTRR